MKILRKGDDFVKVKDMSREDLIKINTLTERGWNYVSKQEYKDFYKEEKTVSEVKAEAKKAEVKAETKKDRKEKKEDKSKKKKR